MARPYSNDLRERVVAAVMRDGVSRREAAQRFGVGVSTAIRWVQRWGETGSIEPGQVGGAGRRFQRREPLEGQRRGASAQEADRRMAKLAARTLPRTRLHLAWSGQ
jgi:transposase